MTIQLNPPIPVDVLGKGEGYAVGWIDYSQEHDLFWVVFLDNRECWIVPNKEVCACRNWSLERREIAP